MSYWESRLTCSETYVSGGQENYSNVTITMQIRRTDYAMIGHSSSAYWYINCNGTTSGNHSLTFNWNNTPAGTWWTVGSYSFKIPHNSDGSKTISCAGGFYTGISPASFAASGSFALTKIGRYANITTYTLSDITQTSVRITWNADAACDSVAYMIEGKQWVYLTGLSFDVTGLDPGKNYKIKISVKRKDSQLWKDSAYKSFTTKPITSISNSSISCNIGEKLSLSFADYAYNKSFLRLYQKNPTDEWTLIDEREDIQQETYEWDLTNFKTTMFDNTPNSNESQIKIICGTTINSKEYTNEYLGKAFVTNSNPVLSTFTFANTDSKSVSMLGNTTTMITYYGNLRVSLTQEQKATPKNSSTISYYNVSVTDPDKTTILKKIEESSSTLFLDFGAFSQSGTVKINIEAVDSRGNISNLISKSFQVYLYHNPSIDLNLSRVNNFEKETSLVINGYISRVYASSNRNSLQSLKYRYRIQNGSWTSYATISPSSSVSGNDFKILYSNALFITLDNQKSYDFEFVITDKMQSITYVTSVGQGSPLMTVSDNGTVLIGEIPNQDNLSSNCKLIVASDVIVTDSESNQRKVLETISEKITFTESEEIEPENLIDNSIWCPIIATIDLSSS